MGYGADLRPPVAAATPTPPMSQAAPGSAPVSPASASGATGQPAVVRQQPTAIPAQTAETAARLTERAVAATATGGALGETAAGVKAVDRLRRLLEAVARQQPQLRWAIGDLEDGTTVLATDLAGGWIPPHIAIPTGVRLLPPTASRRNLGSLLGVTALNAAYEPGQYLSPDSEPVPMSIRARDTAPVDELGWQLSQSTKWRDGLPRLAHTLARAASAKTGFLDSEVDLLQEHITAIARNVLSRYPSNVDPTQVGNWQLLATIEALINDETTSANYHFAWFQAQALTREGLR